MAATVEGGRNVCAVLRAKGDLQLVSQHLFLSLKTYPIFKTVSVYSFINYMY